MFLQYCNTLYFTLSTEGCWTTYHGRGLPYLQCVNMARSLSNPNSLLQLPKYCFWYNTSDINLVGFYSFRRGSGSWFITSLCQMLQMYSTELDLMSLITKVNYQVAVQFESNTPSRPMMHKRHVVPWTASMLTKEVWFKPKDNDDRRVVFV